LNLVFVAGVRFSQAIVCVSVYLHDISKTDAARITKLDVQMFRDVPFILGSKGRRSTSRVTKTVPAWSLHSYDCWLLL